MFDWVQKLNGIKHSCRHVLHKTVGCRRVIDDQSLTSQFQIVVFFLKVGMS